MAKKNEILVPIGGTPVKKFGLEFRAQPLDPKEHLGPCKVEVRQGQAVFVLEAAHDGRSSTKFEYIGGVHVRYDRTGFVRNANKKADGKEHIRIAVIAFRKPVVQPEKVDKFRRKDRRLNKRMSDRAE